MRVAYGSNSNEQALGVRVGRSSHSQTTAGGEEVQSFGREFGSLPKF